MCVCVLENHDLFRDFLLNGQFDAEDRPCISDVATLLDDHHEHLELKKYEDELQADDDVWASTMTPQSTSRF